jgi:SAM-dependent methyltransferase
MNSPDTESTTLASYASRASAFWEGTRDHDVSQNIAALLSHIRADPPYQILDFGCGPGRDLKSFRDLGHHPVGLDGVAAFVEMARAYAGCEVWQQSFANLALPAERFDGVFANASLFHVPRLELPGVLRALHTTLRPGGVLFASIPHGDDAEGWRGERGDRYGVAHRWESWRAFLLEADFAEITHFYRPDGLPREQQPWLASVWRKETSR